jgi:hypothetical protein
MMMNTHTLNSVKHDILSSAIPANRKKRRTIFYISSVAIFLSQSVRSFAPLQNPSFNRPRTFYQRQQESDMLAIRKHTNTKLQVKWFGGGWQDTNTSDERLSVKIEKLTPNSRRIAGEIIISKPMDDVWAILTDYDNLAIHVPNLVESRRVDSVNALPDNSQGNGEYKCRLFQKGAQKIIGFEFGASVTMDMTENIRMANVVAPRVLKLGREKNIPVNQQKRISFKCVESQFFSEFDGEWRCTWIDDPNDAFELATKVEYIVDVKPRGPVPVQALEWRIREDVPTNLRAVKVASTAVGLDGVLKLREKNSLQAIQYEVQNAISEKTNTSTAKTSSRKKRRNIEQLVLSGGKRISQRLNQTQTTRQLAPVRVQWYDDETMARYMDNNNQ